MQDDGRELPVTSTDTDLATSPDDYCEEIDPATSRNDCCDEPTHIRPCNSPSGPPPHRSAAPLLTHDTPSTTNSPPIATSSSPPMHHRSFGLWRVDVVCVHADQWFHRFPNMHMDEFDAYDTKSWPHGIIGPDCSIVDVTTTFSRPPGWLIIYGAPPSRPPHVDRFLISRHMAVWGRFEDVVIAVANLPEEHTPDPFQSI
mgnify:CR=1 FL=1